MPAPRALADDRVLPGDTGVVTKLALMRRIDALNLDHPFAEARMLRDLLRHDLTVTDIQLCDTSFSRIILT